MVDIDNELIQEAMGYLTNDQQKALDKIISNMSDEHKYYFMGYVAGYTEAVKHLSAAQNNE